MPQPMEALLDLRKFVAPEFVYGLDSSTLAGRYARNLSARRVLVVSDPGVAEVGLDRSRWKESLRSRAGPRWCASWT